MGREGAVIAQLLPEFTKIHPDIEVRIQQLPCTAAHQKLLTAFAGQATPDLCQLGNPWIPAFVPLHAHNPLDRSRARSQAARANDYVSLNSDTNVSDGTH